MSQYCDVSCDMVVYHTILYNIIYYIMTLYYVNKYINVQDDTTMYHISNNIIS